MPIIDITDLNSDGDGVGRIDGLVAFIPGAVPADRVEVQLVKKHKRYARGRIVDVVDYSPVRVDSVCGISNECGGCQLQHVSYDYQVKWKRRRLVELMNRIGSITEHEPEMLKDNSPWYYRSRIQLPAGVSDGNLVCGCFKQGGHDVVPMTDCAIQHPVVNRVRKAATEITRDIGIEPYDRRLNRGQLRHIAIRTSVPGNRALCTLVVSKRGKLELEFAQQLARECSEVAGVTVNVNPGVGSSVFGLQTEVLWGDGEIEQTIGGVEFALGPITFFQVNISQAEKLFACALEMMPEWDGMRVLDVYAGVGPISLLAARNGAQVTAIEYSSEAVRLGQRASDRYGLNVGFMVGDARAQVGVLVKLGYRPDVVILDPPRGGCEADVLHAVSALMPEKIVYVSCNPATLARDIRVLKSYGFELIRWKGIDMFPHTTHVETVVLMSRVEK